MNYLRNNTTGATYNFDSMPIPGGMGGGQNALMPDYSAPIDVYGQKGYRIKGDPSGVLLADGRKITLDQNPDLTRARQMQALEMEKAGLNNQLLEAQIRQSSQKEVPSWQTIETQNGTVAFNPKTLETRPLTSPGGEAIQKNQPLTEFQGKSTGFGMRAQNSSDIIDNIGEGGKVQPNLFKQGVESVPLIGGALAMGVNSLPESFGGPSAKQQQIEQAQRDFVNSVLRQESGAAISSGEFDNARNQYFPLPGDSPEVIAQKKNNRQLAINGFKISAGPGAKNFTQAQAQPSGAAGQAIDQAKSAIASGAPRDAVVRRLEQLGVTNHGL